MSQRPHVYVCHDTPADPGVSPNAFVGRATAEIRVYWTPTDPEKGWKVFEDAVAEARERLEEVLPRS